MKAMKFFAASLFFLTALTACTVEEYYTDDKEEWYLEDFTIKSYDWTLVNGKNQIGSYFEYVFDKIPLDDSYYDGIVTAYTYKKYGTRDEEQVPLPYTEYHVDTNEWGDDIYYSVQYSYDVRKDGTISFKIYISDYFTGDFYPDTRPFRVAIVWPTY